MDSPTMTSSIEGSAPPAEPVLASSLITDTELDALYDTIINSAPRSEPRDEPHRLTTGLRSIDDALGGGLPAGKVAGVSCGDGSAVGICLTLLANALLKDSNCLVAVVDAVGDVDVVRLFRVIMGWLRADAQVVRAHGDGSVEEMAKRVLERVRIMRVFDLVGFSEAMVEVREGLEGTSGNGERERDESGLEKSREEESAKKTVIADSEDEEEDEDEMLFPTETVTGGRTEHRSELASGDQAGGVGASIEGSAAQQGRFAFVLVNNLAHAVNLAMRNDYNETHALTSSFLLTLVNLTRTHNLHTVLLNPSTLPRPAPSKPIQSDAQQSTHSRSQYQLPISPSIFTSNKQVPALSNVLTPFLDLHVLVEKMPRKDSDAKIAYADEGGREARKGAEMVGVLEVVLDRCDGREGAWGTFVESGAGIKDFK